MIGLSSIKHVRKGRSKYVFGRLVGEFMWMRVDESGIFNSMNFSCVNTSWKLSKSLRARAVRTRGCWRGQSILIEPTYLVFPGIRILEFVVQVVIQLVSLKS